MVISIIYHLMIFNQHTLLNYLLILTHNLHYKLHISNQVHYINNNFTQEFLNKNFLKLNKNLSYIKNKYFNHNLKTLYIYQGSKMI